MELFNYELIDWMEDGKVPTEPGLYLFCYDHDHEYPLVHLVGINYDSTMDELVADADSFVTWTILSNVRAGKWSKKICFDQT